MSDSAIRRATLIGCAVLAVYSLARLELTNSITHFMPSNHDIELVELSLQLMDSPLSRRMVISIGGGPERARVATRLGEFLRGHPEVAWVESGFDEDAVRGIFELYFERRNYLVSSTPETEIPLLAENRALAKRANQLRSRLVRPDSIWVARLASADPLGLFDRILERIRATKPVTGRTGGGFESLTGDFAIVLFGLTSSPFDFKAQAGLLDDIDREFERLRAAEATDLEMEQSGINLIAVASERQVKGEVNFISAASISIVILLFLVVFRSLRHLFVAVLTPLIGFLVALGLAVTASAQMHGITLAFGFVLLGVAIDYPIHLMNHHSLSAPGTSARDTLDEIRPSLLSSGLTTTLAFLALAISDFPGLREMGLFAAIGIPVSLAFTLFCLPAFLGENPQPSPTQRTLSEGFERLVIWLEARRFLTFVILAIFVTVAATGLPGTRWEDDPAQLMAADPELLAESDRVRRRVADFDQGRFVVGIANDPEAALALNDEIHARLSRAIEAGDFDRMMSLHSFIWSKALQQKNLEAMRAQQALGERIDEVFSQAGFRRGAFSRFEQSLANPLSAPLTPEDFMDSPLSRVMDSLVELDGRWAVVTYLRGVRSGDDVRALLADLDGVHYMDQTEIISEVYRGFREDTLRMIGLGSVIVFIVLVVRYRVFMRGVLAFLPPGLAALATFGLFGLLDIQVNVVSAVSLLVVLGMGVDYGIFVVDSALYPERLGPTLSSLLISCLTSISVFGVLALSEQSALHSLGLTVAVGTSFALILSPTTYILARRLKTARSSSS